MDKRFIRIHQNDNVAVALEDVPAGSHVTVDGKEYTVDGDIPFGHKMALEDRKTGEMVVKYGCPIGHTTTDVPAGSWLHSHNMATNLEGVLDYTYEPVSPRQKCTGILPDTFMGYLRADGRAAIRNEIWIIPTVSCVNTTVNIIAEQARTLYGDKCDGIFAYPHNAGCSQLGDDFDTTQKLLSAIVHHPNAGGVLLVSLGCENNDFDHFLPVLGDYDRSRIKCLITQNVEGDEVEEALKLVGEIAEETAKDVRQELPVSKLKIGFKCGGSDAFSGITANPLCGTIAEKVTDLGGSAVLTEVPEMFGAETQLMNRADSEETFGKVVAMINGFKQYYMDYNQPIYENPSPGNDSVSITDLLASGVQLLLFTTGRGNPLGTAIPTIKLASNTSLYERKNAWIDFNAGIVLERHSFDQASEELWKLVIDVASGKVRTKSEKSGYKEIMIFKNGVIL